MPLNEQDQKLLVAVKNNDVKEVEKIIRHSNDEKDSKAVNVDINCILPHDDKEMPYSTPLHIAVSNINPDMVALLLKHDAKTYLVNKDFQTPIQLATDMMQNPPDAKNIEKIEAVLSLFLRHRMPINFETY